MSNNDMSKNDTLRFKVCVSAGYPEFYEHLKELGPYYRSRRLLELAHIGYSVQKGLAAQGEHPVPTDEQSSPPPDALDGRKQGYYEIDESSASQLADMLDALDN